MGRTGKAYLHQSNMMTEIKRVLFSLKLNFSQKFVEINLFSFGALRNRISPIKGLLKHPRTSHKCTGETYFFRTLKLIHYTYFHDNVNNKIKNDDILWCPTGRVVQGRWGGGLKSKYRWIDFDRNGPTEREQYKVNKQTIFIEKRTSILHHPATAAAVAAHFSN